MAVDTSGNIYIANGNYVGTSKFSSAGQFTVHPSAIFPAGQSCCGYIRALAVDSSGNVYVSDGNYNQIVEITPAGVGSVLIAGNSPYVGSPVSIPGTPTGLVVTGLAVDASGNIYVGDRGNNVILKISSAGVVSTFAGNGSAGSANGPAASASFNVPLALALDSAGNLYVIDQINLIRKITPAGVVSTLAGSVATGTANGVGTAASFNSPSGIAVDASGNVYVADTGNNLIRMITPAGVVTTLAGSGAAGFANGTGTAASFNFPSGVAVDQSGNVYVADEDNNAIRKISPQ